jgi:HemK-related putative methylase
MFNKIKFVIFYAIFILANSHLAFADAPKIKFVEAQESFIAKNKLIKERYTFEVLGKTFVGYPNVFSPKACGEDGFFAKQVPIHKGDTVLELGAGTGFFPVFAIEKGASKVIATDVNPDAVKNTDENVKLHKMESKITVIQSDVFAQIQPDQKFDVIYWNIPFTPTKKKNLDLLDLSVFDPNNQLLERYLADGAKFLTPKGKIYLGYSATHGDVDKMKALAKKYAWDVHLVVSAGDENTIIVQLYEFTRIATQDL